MEEERYMFVLVVNLQHNIVRMMRHHTLCKVHHYWIFGVNQRKDIVASESHVLGSRV